MKKQYWIAQRVEKLGKLSSMEGIFVNTFENGDRIYARYTENGSQRSLTFSDYLKIVNKMSACIVKILGTGNRGRFIGLKADNSPYWLSVFWGLMMSGFKPVLIGFTEDDERTGGILEQCRAAGIISDSDMTGVKTEGGLATIQFKSLVNSIESGSDSLEEVGSPAWSNEFAVCTSGTTGMPKICLYNGRAVAAQIRICQKANGKINTRIIYDEEMRILAFLPFHHIFGLLSSIAYGYFGKSFVYLRNRAPSTILETCRLHRVTVIYSVPLFYNNVVKSILGKASKNKSMFRKFKGLVNMSILIQKILPEAVARPIAARMFRKVREALFGNDIDFMACGGGYVPPETVRLLNAFGYYTSCGFGMTEAGVTSFESGKSLDRRIKGSLGKPHFGVRYRLTAEDELQLKGEVLYTGEIIDGEVHPADLDGEGWFSTGDIASLTSKGMRIVGRRKEVIINESGENVYPDELESKFSELEEARQLCVLGIKNEKGYEDIALAVNVGELVNDKNVINRISSMVHSVNITLPVFKRIQRLFITDRELPNANKIKVKRLELKEMLEKGSKHFILQPIQKMTSGKYRKS